MNTYTNKLIERSILNKYLTKNLKNFLIYKHLYNVIMNNTKDGNVCKYEA